MASASVGTAGAAGIGERLLTCVTAQGSTAHPYPASQLLLRGPDAARNLSDAVHFLCLLHGRHPGVIDHAALRSVDQTEREWFGRAAPAFAAERAFLTRLAVAAGPLPSTPGSAESEAAALAQRHALAMLANSERKGCALGAAAALVADWAAIRSVLDAAAQRFGVEAPLCALDRPAEVADFTAAAGAAGGVERALMFGAEQVVLQHFGLWDLLEARQQARAAG